MTEEAGIDEEWDGLILTDFFIPELPAWSLTQDARGLQALPMPAPPTPSGPLTASPHHAVSGLGSLEGGPGHLLGVGRGSGLAGDRQGITSGWQDYGLIVPKGNCFC